MSSQQWPRMLIFVRYRIVDRTLAVSRAQRSLIRAAHRVAGGTM